MGFLVGCTDFTGFSLLEEVMTSSSLCQERSKQSECKVNVTVFTGDWAHSVTAQYLEDKKEEKFHNG